MPDCETVDLASCGSEACGVDAGTPFGEAWFILKTPNISIDSHVLQVRLKIREWN